jgi:hypothetical protein
MRRSMWTYAWDIHDLGIDEVTRDLRERAGLNSVSLATSYHAGRFLQPRSPRRKVYFPEDGTIYFQPTPSLWEGSVMKPLVARTVAEGGDVLADLVRRRDKSGLAVSCWTVCLHNMRLGVLHPDTVTRSAFGDPNPFSLCPSNPLARTYVRTLVEDLTKTYKPDMVELESPSFMGYEHGYHHEKDGVGLLPEDDLVFSLCFCPSCLSLSTKAGVDGARARETARRFIVETCERETPLARFPRLSQDGIDAFRSHPDLYEYLVWRFEPVTSLVAEIREAADPASLVTVIDLKEGWLGGCDAAALGGACDGLILCAYDMEPPAVAELIAAGREAVGPDKFLGAGFRLFYPEMKGREAVAERTEAAVRAGADGLNFYNYGLVPAARLDWALAAASA